MGLSSRLSANHAIFASCPDDGAGAGDGDDDGAGADDGDDDDDGGDAHFAHQHLHCQSKPIADISCQPCSVAVALQALAMLCNKARQAMPFPPKCSVAGQAGVG